MVLVYAHTDLPYILLVFVAVTVGCCPLRDTANSTVALPFPAAALSAQMMTVLTAVPPTGAHRAPCAKTLVRYS